MIGGLVGLFEERWSIIQRPRNSSASSARSTQCARFPRLPVVKNATPPSVVAATIVSRKVSVAVLSQFFVVLRRHPRRSLLDSPASPARRLQCTAWAAFVSSSGQLKRRRSTPNQHGK